MEKKLTKLIIRRRGNRRGGTRWKTKKEELRKRGPTKKEPLVAETWARKEGLWGVWLSCGSRTYAVEKKIPKVGKREDVCRYRLEETL